MKNGLFCEWKDDITLHLPEQTYDECNRNRETKIADALKKLKEEKLNNLFPQICKEYPEYKKIRNAIKLFDENKSSILEKLNKTSRRLREGNPNKRLSGKW